MSANLRDYRHYLTSQDGTTECKVQRLSRGLSNPFDGLRNTQTFSTHPSNSHIFPSCLWSWWFVFAAIYFVVLYLQVCVKRSDLGAIHQLETRTLSPVVPPSCVETLGPGFKSPQQRSIFSTIFLQINKLFAPRTRFGPFHACSKYFASSHCLSGAFFRLCVWHILRTGNFLRSSPCW